MSEDSTNQIVFKVQRYNPENGSAPHFQEFTVAARQGMTVLEGLLFIKENIDSSLTFRASCRMGICGSCAVMVNSYPHLACHTQIEELHADRLTVKPLPNLPIIKDLVVDLTSFLSAHRSLKPYIIRADAAEMETPTAEFAMLPEELMNFLQFTYCIKCGICLAACPTSASDKLFLGPQALAQCYRYCADKRDAGERERFPMAGSEHGVWHCHLAGACSEACPKGVDPGLAIQLLKRRLLSQTLRSGKKQQPSQIISPPTETKPKIPFPELTAKGD